MGLLAPGAVLAGYRIESVVGRGGMGVVYRAVELELDRVVALKVIAPELVEDRDVRERFLREARAAASIEHPNVIPVHAAGGGAEGPAYLAMRFIDGDDARTLVRHGGALSAGRAADIVAQAAAGLDAIHRTGYVHRDVKPANVLVDGDGHVYVTDFGLAKRTLTAAGQATRSGQWVGTLDYIAPEQIRGGRIDARADVYALGGVLCFLLTGRVPFDREGDEAKLFAQLSEPPPVPSHVRPGLPGEFDAVVARAMAKTPGERYPSAGDLGRAARAAAAGVVPSQPERVVARGAAAPEGAPVETGIIAETSTITARRPEQLPATVVASASASARRFPRRALALIPLVAAAAAAVVFWPSEEAKPGDRAATAGPPQLRVLQTIHDVGDHANGLALAGGDVWVTSAASATVDRVDAATGRPHGPRPRVGVGVSSIAADGSSLWVAVKSTQTVRRIDAETGRITKTLRPGGTPMKLAVGLGSLWVATNTGKGRSSLVRYDARGRELQRRTVPRGIAALTAGAGALWILERDAPNVVRLDPATGSVRHWWRLPNEATTLFAGAGYVWAPLPALNSISRIDVRRPGAVTTAAGEHPQNGAAVAGRILVTNNTEHTVLVINPLNAKPMGAPLPVEHNPFSIVPDGRGAWVTGIGENTLMHIGYS